MSQPYPPPHHLLRDLRFETQQVAADETVVRCDLIDELRDVGGSARAGLLAILIDISGAAMALRSVAPDWIATVDLSYTARRPLAVGPIAVTARPLRLGSRLVVIGAEVADTEGAAGTSLLTFSRIPGHATVAEPADSEAATSTSLALPGSGFTAPLDDQLGIRLVDRQRGIVELEKTDYVVNSFGTINGGAVAVALDAAAAAAGTVALGSPAATTDLAIRYLAQAGDGPVRTAAEVLRSTAGTAVLQLSLSDPSKPRDQLLTVATATVAAV